MYLFLTGLVLFFCMHVLTVTPLLRREVLGRLSDPQRKTTVAILSLGGIVLVGMGWHAVPEDLMFSPILLVRGAAPWLVSVAFILFVAGGVGVRSYIRRHLHHPMLIGVTLWSVVHLMANGGLRETLLFGSFLAFSLYALAIEFSCGKRAVFTPSLRWDGVVVISGLLAAGGIMHAHRLLFGVAVIG